MADAPAKKNLTVTSCKVLTSFKNAKGDDATLYEVEAVGEDGRKVDEKLRSFVELKLDELIEYEVSRYDHEKYGLSYTLKPPSKKSGLAASVDALRERVDKLERQNVWLYQQITKDQPPEPSSQPSTARSQSEPTQPPEEAAPAGAGDPPAGDDDIPF